MLRFLSRRKARNAAAVPAANNDGAQAIKAKSGAESKPKKNMIQCRIVLLDGTDLSVDLTVSDKPKL